MPTVRITWTDSTTPGVIGTKIYRDDNPVPIGNVGNGVQTFDDPNAIIGNNKYEVQAYTSTEETTAEVIGVNVETISIISVITNYVFDGGALSYMLDKAAVSSMLDGIVNQSWMIRIKFDAGTELTNRGMIGTANGFGNTLYLANRSDNRIDFTLRDTGESMVTNATVSTDLGVWRTYFLEYDGATMMVYEEDVLAKADASALFVGRTDGRRFTAGGTSFPGTAIYLKGEISNIRFFSRVTTAGEKTTLSADPDATIADTVANFSTLKTANGDLAGDWTDSVNGHVLENAGTVKWN